MVWEEYKEAVTSLVSKNLDGDNLNLKYLLMYYLTYDTKNCSVTLRRWLTRWPRRLPWPPFPKLLMHTGKCIKGLKLSTPQSLQFYQQLLPRNIKKNEIEEIMFYSMTWMTFYRRFYPKCEENMNIYIVYFPFNVLFLKLSKKVLNAWHFGNIQDRVMQLVLPVIS